MRFRIAAVRFIRWSAWALPPLPKGKKEIIQAHAEARGESVNGFINRAIDAVMEQDTERGDQK